MDLYVSPWIGKTIRRYIKHGGYFIYVDGNTYVAETSPAEDQVFFLQLRSVLLQRIVDAIDDLNECADRLPPWLAGWARGEECIIDLDALAIKYKTIPRQRVKPLKPGQSYSKPEY